MANEPQTNRRRPRSGLLLGCIVLPVLLLVTLLTLPSFLHHSAKTKLEKWVGPLGREHFVRPQEPPSAPGPRLLAAAQRIQLSDTERDLLKKSARAGLPGARADRSALVPLLEKHRESLDQAYALEAGASSLNIDYTVPDVTFPNFLQELNLARMVYLEGVLAVADGNRDGVIRSVRSLGRQAALLEEEPELFIQVIGLSVEKLQLDLLVRWIGEPAAQGPNPFLLLLSNDLRARYREALALSATHSETSTRSILERNPYRFLGGRTIANALLAAAFDRDRLYAEAYDRDYASMRSELGKDSHEMGIWEKTGRIAGLTATDLPSLYRATTASRDLVKACLNVRFSSRPCEDEAQIRAIHKPDGSCTLQTADGRDYLRLFVKENNRPIPQECTIQGAGHSA
jgi:hypothetical protein